MARVICVKPCVPSFDAVLTIPYMGPFKAIGDINLKTDCSGCELVVNLFAQLNPFMMSLGIPLCVLNCLGGIVQFAQSIPDALGPPPDPTKIATALANIAVQCKCVITSILPPPAGLICQFLKMIIGLLSAVLSVVECMNSLLSHLLTLKLRAAIALGDLNIGFQKLGICLNQEADTLLQNVLVKFNLIAVLFSAMEVIFTLVNAAIPIPQLAQINQAFATFTAATSGSPAIADVQSALTALQTALTDVIVALQYAAIVCP